MKKRTRSEAERAEHAAQILNTLPPGATLEDALKIADELFETVEKFIKRNNPKRRVDPFAINPYRKGNQHVF